MLTELVCPHCENGDNLGTVEKLLAVAFCELRRDTNGQVRPDYAGESDVIWDSQTWDGKRVVCRGCGEEMDTAALLPACTCDADETGEGHRDDCALAVAAKRVTADS